MINATFYPWLASINFSISLVCIESRKRGQLIVLCLSGFPRGNAPHTDVCLGVLWFFTLRSFGTKVFLPEFLVMEEWSKRDIKVKTLRAASARGASSLYALKGRCNFRVSRRKWAQMESDFCAAFTNWNSIRDQTIQTRKFGEIWGALVSWKNLDFAFHLSRGGGKHESRGQKAVVAAFSSLFTLSHLENDR